MGKFRASLYIVLTFAIFWCVSSDETCSANGDCSGASSLPEEDTKCVRWRQTGGCDPDGPREKQGDKACSEEIPTGSSGYCQCGVCAQKTRVRLSTCDHRP